MLTLKEKIQILIDLEEVEFGYLIREVSDGVEIHYSDIPDILKEGELPKIRLYGALITEASSFAAKYLTDCSLYIQDNYMMVKDTQPFSDMDDKAFALWLKLN